MGTPSYGMPAIPPTLTELYKRGADSRVQSPVELPGRPGSGLQAPGEPRGAYGWGKKAAWVLGFFFARLEILGGAKIFSG